MPDGEHLADLIIGAEPVELAGLEAHAFSLQLLDQRQRVGNEDFAAILSPPAINVVGRDRAPGAGHVLDQEARIAGNVLAEVVGNETPIEVIASSRSGAHDERDSS